MMYNRKRMVKVSALALGALIAGCHHNTRPVANFRSTDSNQGLVAVVPSYYVDLDLPTVVIDHGVTSITGSVRRKPGIRWTLAGRVDIEFISSDGELLDGLPALITPRAIPMDPNQASIYTTNYGYVPPPGSTVRVHFVDSDTQAQEDLEGSSIYTGMGGSAHAAGAGHAGGHGGGGHSMR